MKRSFIVGLFGSFVGCGPLLILLSADSQADILPSDPAAQQVPTRCWWTELDILGQIQRV
jgi:hypothetical protein